MGCLFMGFRKGYSISSKNIQNHSTFYEISMGFHGDGPWDITIRWTMGFNDGPWDFFMKKTMGHIGSSYNSMKLNWQGWWVNQFKEQTQGTWCQQPLVSTKLGATAGIPFALVPRTKQRFRSDHRNPWRYPFNHPMNIPFISSNHTYPINAHHIPSIPIIHYHSGFSTWNWGHRPRCRREWSASRTERSLDQTSQRWAWDFAQVFFGELVDFLKKGQARKIGIEAEKSDLFFF